MDIKRRLVQAKFFMTRAYGWISVPAMIAVVVGVLSPYVQRYYEINMVWIGIISFLGLVCLGLIDHFLGLSKKEISFAHEQNTLNLGYLKRIEGKIDKLLEEEDGL